MNRPRRRSSASSRVSVFVSVSRRVSGSAKPAVGERGDERCGVGKAFAVDHRDPRDESGDPHGLEVVRVERPDCEPPARGQHTRGLGEGRGELHVLDDLAHERRVEPARLEREPLGAGLLEAASRQMPSPRDREHLRRRIDAPRAGAAGRERLGDPAGAAADVQDAAAVEAAEVHERVEHRLPHGVARAQLVVASGEVGEWISPRRRRAQISPRISSGSVRASIASCAASTSFPSTSTLVGTSSSSVRWCSTAG